MTRAVLPILLSAAFVAYWLGAVVPSASAEGESYGESYSVSLESICHASAERSLRPRSILETSARLLAREARNLETTVDKLAAVEAPDADQLSMNTWLKQLKIHASLLIQTSRELKLGRTSRARQLVSLTGPPSSVHPA